MKQRYLNSFNASSKDGKHWQEILTAESDVVIMSRADISVAVSKRDCSLIGRRRDAIEVKVRSTLVVSLWAAAITGAVLGRERR